MPDGLSMLAQTAPAPEAAFRLIGWGLAAAAAAGALFWLSRVLRRRIQRDEQPFGATWSMEKLRQLYERGELSSEEYERLRARTVAEVTRGTVETSRRGR